MTAVARRVVLASGNAGKLREITALLAPLNWEVTAQSEFDVPEAVEEAPTFVENALIKARNAARHTGLPALADDSGLAVDALGGAPGIRSARYAGADTDDTRNIEKLLAALEGVPAAQRAARFVCVAVFLHHADDPIPVVCQGIWRGRILERPVGRRGFGYDPVFYVPTHGVSAAQLDPEEKNRVSHRGQALRCLVEALGGPAASA